MLPDNFRPLFFLLPALAICLGLGPSQGLAAAPEIDSCAVCHTDDGLMDELTEDVIAKAEVPEESELQEGKGYAVQPAPFDLYEKMLVAPEFLESDHGRIACAVCHGGNSTSMEMDIAHQGMTADPSMTDPDKACGTCHPAIVQSAKDSLHARPTVLEKTLQQRCSPEQWQTLQQHAVTDDLSSRI